MASVPAPQPLQALVQRERRRRSVPGIAAGVLREGRVETATAGVASRARGEPVTADTPFRVASITKPFTAQLALDLGLPLEQPLEDEFRVTLRQALSHTSGLFSELPRTRIVEPDSLWSYCNAGFWLAAAAVERATGRTYEGVLHDRVLEPHGLAATGFETPAGAAEGHVVADADAGRDEAAPAVAYPRARRASGGLWSTVPDLLRFAAFHLGRSPIPRLMRERQTAAVGCDWGLGVALEWIDGALVAGHEGSWGGFRSKLAVVPQRQLAVVVLTNSERGGAAARAICDAVLADAGLVRPEPVPVALPASALRRFAGHYRHPQAEVHVTVAGAGLHVESEWRDAVSGRTGRDLPVRGVPVGPTEFVVLEGDDAGSRFDFPRDGLARWRWRLAARLDR